MEEPIKLNITIDNLTKAQAIAIEDMLAVMELTSLLGNDRFVGYYVNPSEGFRPEILINGSSPQKTKLINTNKCYHSIKIKVAPTVENGLKETTWVDEDNVYLADNGEIQQVLDDMEYRNQDI